jgi:two-component system sensor histidine kinase ChvG
MNFESRIETALEGQMERPAAPPEGREPRAETLSPSLDSGLVSKRAKSARRHRRRGWRSPLTLRILLINVLVLVIPVLGLLHLDQYRQTLITSELDALRIQGRAFALSLGSTAVEAGANGREELVPEQTRALMRVLLADTRVRARVFARSGDLLADSFILSGPGGQVQVIELPPSDTGHLAEMGRLYDQIVNWLPGKDDLPLYRESARQRAADYHEVEAALGGDHQGMARVDQDGHLVLSSAIPVQRYRQVLGVLMLSKGGGDINAAVEERRRDILKVFAVALGVTVLLSLYLAGTIARPIRRLAEAADMVRYGKGRQFEIPDLRRRGDEVGDLSGALRDMTEALWMRLDAIEGFAADVAHEIKNPLTSLRSAVETVARVEDPEQQKRLMTIILDISDASRIDAELSRAQSETVDIAKLLDALTEIHQATAGEEGPRIELDVARHLDLTVQGLEGRLGQVFRNLISNAITFNPPGGLIRLSARRDGPQVVVAISDEGPGIPEGKLEAVFDRFYSERPKTEKFGTHSGLGLSISRQILEAHDGTIQAENRLDDEGRVLGARFVIRLPAE